MKTIKKIVRWIIDTYKEIERIQQELLEQQIKVIRKQPRDSKGRFCK